MSRSVFRLLPAAFSLALFTSAGLLFIVEPMIAKMILPFLGGTPAVWNTCMMFFQVILLTGYAYAHFISFRLSIRSQIIIQAVLLLFSLFFLPVVIRYNIFSSGETDPVGIVTLVLLTSVGLPFFVLSSMAPLLQKWFAGTGHPSARDPYFLYSASNTGSMLALISYPVLIEPGLNLAEQSRSWMAGYIILGILTLGCAYLTWKNRLAIIESDSNTDCQDIPQDNSCISWSTRFLWIVLAFVPSSLMLGVTTFLTTNVAAVPLFWVIPLALYLLSFIIVFAKKSGDKLHKTMILLMLVSLTLIIIQRYFPEPLHKWQIFVINLFNLFFVSMVCHGELVRNRPSTKHLTEFYLFMSFGGALGGIFNALIAPLVFDSIIEYPFALLMSVLLLPLTNKYLKLAKYILAGHIIIVNLFLSGQIYEKLIPDIVYQERNFFGVISVEKDPGTNALNFVHGTTIHGQQSLDPALRSEPTTYYQRQGAVGEYFSAFKGKNMKRRVALIGLGIGTMASYGEPGEEFDFYEINPAVKRVAENSSFFTYLRDSRANWKIIIGDARLEIEKTPAQYYDLMVLDAFSSDAIPVHLLTREALRLYLSKLNETGVLLVHISNSHLNLEPVVEKLAADAGLASRIRIDQLGIFISTWVILGRKDDDLGAISQNSYWRNLQGKDSIKVWTDDFSNIASSFIKPKFLRRS